MGDLHDQFAGLHSAMRDLRADIKSELSGLRDDFRNGFTELRNNVRSELSPVRRDVAYLRGRSDVLIWAVGINAAATIAILGVLLRH